MTVSWNESRRRWQYDFQRGGKRFAGYCLDEQGQPVTSRRAAEDAEGRVKAAALAAVVPAAPVPASGGYTLAEAVADWADSVAQYNRSWRQIRRYLRDVLAFFGAATVCRDITEARVEDYVAWSRAQQARRYVGGPRSGGTMKDLGRTRSVGNINRHLNALRAVLRRAHKLRHTGQMVSVPRLRELLEAPNPIRRDDLARLLAVAPVHVRRALLLCTHTGMRLQECLGLTWPQVDLERRTITLGSNTKAGKGRVIPLNEVAVAALREIAGEPCHDSWRVILYRHKGKGRPRPVAAITRAWKGALAECGLSGRYRFHDSRAAFCTYLAELGIDAVHVQTLAGHASITTTLRYIRPAEARLRHAVDLLAGAAPR